jgi:predicted kinase
MAEKKRRVEWSSEDVEWDEAEAVERGGPGSGHFAHEGRPGKVGGSAPSGYSEQDERERVWYEGRSGRETIGEWLDRQGVERTPEGLYKFYHATPKAGGATSELRKGSLLETDAEKAAYFAARDRDLDPEKDIEVHTLFLRPSQVEGGVWGSLLEDIPLADDFNASPKKVSTATKDTSAKEFKPEGTAAVKAPISIAPKLTIGEQDKTPEPVEQFDDGSAIVDGRRSWLSEQEIERASGELGVGEHGEILEAGPGWDQAVVDDGIIKATVATDRNMTKDDWQRWDALRQSMTEKYDGVVDEFQSRPVNRALNAMRPKYEHQVQMLTEVNDRLEAELAKPTPDPDVLSQYRDDMIRISEKAGTAMEAMEAFGTDLTDVTVALSEAGVPTWESKGEMPGREDELRAVAQTWETAGRGGGYQMALESVGMVKGVLARFANPELVRKVADFSIRAADPLLGSGFCRTQNYMAIDSSATPPVVAHEYGHAFSDSNPKVGDLAKMFLLYRTQGDGSIPFRGNPYIQVKPDAFISEYTGRFYTRNEGGPVSGEEVFSMGIQFLTANPAEFSRRDPEHMAFTLALLAGDWEKAEAVVRGLSFSPLVKRLLPAGGWQDAAQRLGEALGLVQAPQKPAPVVRPVPAPQEGTADLLRLPTALHGTGIWGTAYTTEGAARLAQDVLARQPEDVRKALAKAEADLTGGTISKEDRALDAGNRKRARARIENQMLRYGEKQDQPEAVLLAGLPGSGKTTLLNNRAHEFRGYVRLSADDVRSRMPNYEGWNSPLLADEADDVLERVMTKAVKEHKPLVLDSMLKTGDTAERIVKALGAHGYRTRVIFVDTPMEMAMERAISRYTSGTGRYVSPAYIASHADKGLHTFERLKSVADAWEHWANDGEAPKKLGEGKRNA